MAESNVVNIRCADVGKLEKFESDSNDAIKEFNRIKTKFKDINDTLLTKWKGAGADQYKTEVDHILEKIGSVSEVLEAINESVKSIKDTYNQIDEDLGKFNENPSSEEGSDS